MRNPIKQKITSKGALIASNLDSWLHAPRTIVMMVAAILCCFVESAKIFRAYSFIGHSLHLTESIFRFYSKVSGKPKIMV